MRHLAIVIAATAGLAVAACSTGTTAASSPPTQAAASTAAPSTPAQPVTKAAARTAATSFFALYSAGQWSAAYALVAPFAQRAVSEKTWAKVHERCPAQAAGLAYDIKGVTLAGDTAVVRYGLAGALSKLGTAVQVFTYSRGRWWFKPSDLGVYRGHTVAQAVAAMKAKGDCAS